MQDDPARPELSPEPSSVASRAVLAWVLGFLLLAAGAAAALSAIYGHWRSGPLIAARQIFPEPRLQTDATVDLRHFLAEQRRILRADAGGRIPIEEAMRKVVARGDHAFDPIGPYSK